jgi:photosystem II stability/assembly factor-like uncharacterized protein
MKKFFSFLFAVVILVAAVNAQDYPTSVGPAPFSNQKVSQESQSYQVGSRYFGQISSSPTFQIAKAFLETCTMTNIGAPFTITFPGGLMLRNGVLYTYNQSSPFQLWSIDTVTGVHTLVFNMTGVPMANFTGMCWDGTTVYGLGTTLAASQIFSINMSTGVCTAIGTASAVNAGGIALLGRNGAQYSLFSTDIVADNLYKCNKTTGVFTLVGPLGANINFGQDAGVDPNDNTFYAMDYSTGPELRKIDTTTGAFGPVLCTYTAQATGIAIVGAGGPPACNYTWASQTSGTANLLQAAWTVNSSVAWIAGAAATVRRTTDGGTTWTDANPNTGVINGDVYNICAIDANNALLTTSPAATFIYRTTNGGTNWTQVFTQAGGFIDAIVMKDASTGFAYGDPVSARWSLWKTINGGATWDSTGLYLAQVGTEAGWNNAMCIVGNNIWFGTNNTKVYRSTNFGATGSWTAGVTTGNVSTYGVWFTSGTNGICTGTIVQVTTDGGATWTNGGTVGGSGNMTSVGGSGTNFWLTRGTNIYGSSDFGATWTAPGFTGTQALWATNIAVTAGCLAGWSSGAAGTVVKLNGIPVGVSSNNNEVPNSYILSQNYPNPFNPQTTISFNIPSSGITSLAVYDIMGREVTVLVNEMKTAGRYSVTFDGTNLSSGVYFYKLTSGTFVESKKMLLIK